MIHSHKKPLPTLRAALHAATVLAGVACAGNASAQAPASFVPSGQNITPTATPGANFQEFDPGIPDHRGYRAGQAIKTALSPDGSTLLVLTSGYNNLNYSSGKDLGDFEPSASYEHVFVYNVAGANAKAPVLQQVTSIADTFEGLAFAPSGTTFYVSGGVDDQVYAYTNGGSGWALSATIPLGHTPPAAAVTATDGIDEGGIGFEQPPSAAGLAVSADGTKLVVANIYNNSISVISTASNTVQYEYNLQPFNTTPSTGTGVAGGERPFSVAIAGSNVYVTSERDREVVVVNIANANATTPPSLVTRIPLSGNPNNLIVDSVTNPTKLYVAQDNSDFVAVIDLADNTIIEQIDTIGPNGFTKTQERYTGAAPNGLAIYGNKLYVTNGGENALAVIPLSGRAPHSVSGLIPTGWYPHSVSVSADGRQLYIVNGKSNPGPNPLYGSSSTYDLKDTRYPGGNAAAQNEFYASNEYDEQLEKAGLLTITVPGSSELATLTRQVATNNAYSAPENSNAARTMAELATKISHVIYIIKENRTYDQVLGDLANGANGDSTLAVFGSRVTPNFHAISTNFVTLDNFYDPAEVSGDGWEWSTEAREPDLVVKQIPLDYAYSPTPTTLNQGGRGAPYEAEGQNSDVDVGIPTITGRELAEPLYPLIASVFPGGVDNFFPGINNDGAADGPDGARQLGYLWDSALNAGLTIRNYGFNIDLGPYTLPAGTPGYIAPCNATPYATGTVQSYATNPTLLPYTDPYFHGFDNNYLDVWRYNEWKREFTGYVANGDLPNLTLLRFMHDHMGNFTSACAQSTGIDYPEAEQADDDYAVGLVADAVAHSPYRGNTLIFVVEDDAQDGADHVDAHRSTAYIIGPYVKQKAIVSTRYTTNNMLRTIEDVLGIDHLSLFDTYAEPMWDVFDVNQSSWTYTAKASPYLRNTADGLVGTKYSDLLPANPVKPASWWAEETKGFDWSHEDRIPSVLFNQIIWKAFKGNTPYPGPVTPASLQKKDDNDD